jgi:OOP family OmpA-OmpF porin
VQVGQKIMFEKASAKLDQHSDVLLDKVADILKDAAGEVKFVQIEGFTSSEGIPAKNKALSQARAESVMKYLLDKGIPQDKLGAKGFGPDDPVAPNDTEENREKNRRVVFHVLEAPPPPPMKPAKPMKPAPPAPKPPPPVKH